MLTPLEREEIREAAASRGRAARRNCRYAHFVRRWPCARGLDLRIVEERLLSAREVRAWHDAWKSAWRRAMISSHEARHPARRRGSHGVDADGDFWAP